MRQLLAPLGARIFAGLTVALLVALGIMTGIAKMEHASAVKWQTSSIQWKAAHDTLEANVRAAQAKASADNKAHVHEVEQRDQEKAQKHETNIANRIAAAELRSRERLRASSGAHSGVAGKSGVSEAANPAAEPADAGGSAQLSPDDERICEINTIKAQGWLDWWKEVSEGER